MGEINSSSVAHMGNDISPLSRVKLKMLTTRQRLVVTILNVTLSSGEIS